MTGGISKYRSYHRIEQDLRRRVVRGEWAVGMLMPGRRELARQYGVDVNTLQRAIGPLLEDGLLVAEGKRGTFVGAKGNSATAESVGAQDGELCAADGLADRNANRSSGKVIGVLVRVDTIAGMETPNTARTLEAVRAIERAFSIKGCSTRVVNMEEETGDTYRTSGAIQAMRSSNMDAVILIDVFDNPSVVADLRMIGYSDETFTVYISSVGNYVPCPHIYFDQQHAGFVAAKELLRSGWNSISFVTPYEANWLSERIEGAHMAVRQVTSREPSFRIFPDSVTLGQYDAEVDARSRAVVEQAFIDGIVAGGIITPNDHVADIVMEMAPQYGCILGRDFAIVGFDDDPKSSLRGLSSVRPPFDAMGEMSVELVWQHLNGESTNMQICARSHLIPRISSAPRPRISLTS